MYAKANILGTVLMYEGFNSNDTQISVGLYQQARIGTPILAVL